MIAALVGRNMRRMGKLLAVAVPALLLFEVGLVHIAAEFEATQFAGGAGLEGLVDMLPGFMQDLVNSQVHEFSTEALVAVGFQHPVMLSLAITLTVLFGVIPAGDRESGLLDVVLSTPVSRSAYLTGTVLCVAFVALLLPAAILAGGAIGLAMVDVPGSPSIATHVQTAVSMGALLLALGSLALLLSMDSQRKGQALSRVAFLLLPLWAIDFVSYLWDGFDAIRWLSPFAYFDAMPDPSPSSRVEYGAFVLLGAFVVTTLAAYRRFAKADL
ncbi:MAG: ABC-type transport system involved in multi-copper enzyme maturation permease subunit [Pseudohongiellaceae bacterium]|jgi:ABC-type transport system involved in multi-copper enzyme maturation permease subunit